MYTYIYAIDIILDNIFGYQRNNSLITDVDYQCVHFTSLLNTETGTTMYITFCCMQTATWFCAIYLIVSIPDLCILPYLNGVVCILTIIRKTK